MVFVGTKSNRKACILGVLVLMACMVDAGAATYYVDGQQGNDGSDGQSLGTAWRTIGNANAHVQPGDIVYIRGGSYDEEIRPGRSGSEGNYITYTNYGDEVPVIDRKEYVAGQRRKAAVDLSGTAYIVIDGLTLKNADRFIRVSSAGYHHCIIKNNAMEYADSGIHVTYGSHHNKFLNNTIVLETLEEINQDYEADAVVIAGSYNVFEENDISMAGHTAIMLAKGNDNLYNVFRNNTLHDCRSSIFVAISSYTRRFLLDGNVFYNPRIGGTRNYGHAFKAYGSQYGIFRRNSVFKNDISGGAENGFFALETKEGLAGHCEHHRFYHNTLYGGYGNGINLGDNSSVYAVRNNVLKNNIVYNAANYQVHQGGELDLSYDELPYENIVFEKNVISKAGAGGDVFSVRATGAYTLEEAQGSYPGTFRNNLDVNPRLVDPDNQDFRLASDSPCRDGGIWLTTVAGGTGEGTVFTVEDAGYFYDGWDIPGEQGDLIQLQGQTETARIVSIDYDNNRITVDRSLSWSAGQGVSLPYHGSLPDIGAFEYAATGQATSPGPTTYVLNTSGAHGTITKAPNQSSYGSGKTVTVQATADDGYEFTGWSGDLSGSTNPAMVTMDADKSITADFAVAAVPTYTLSTSGAHGAIAKTPSQSSYDSGTTVTIQATADDGYEFTGWSGDLSGSTNPAMVTIDGDKSITANFTAVAPTTYTLVTSGTNGWIAKTPDRSSYDSGATVTLQATADGGYEFTGWSGDLSGTTNPATITMDENKVVSATFAMVAPTTYTVSASGTNGTVAKTPDKASYTQGETVTLTATPGAGYSFASWSGDASGTSPSTTITMDDNKSVTANFSINSYTLTVGGTYGSVTKTPDKSSYTHGETVTVTASPNAGYGFAGWSGDLSGGTNPASITMNASKSVTAGFTRQSTDAAPPTVVASSPEADAMQAPRNSLITLHISDDGEGVNAETVTITVDGATVYSGNVAKYDSATGVCRRTGSKADYTFAYQSETEFGFGETITVRVNAADLNGNAINEYVYSFQTEMWVFGGNRRVSWGPGGLDKDRPTTASDSAGNVWVVWHAGVAGRRDIYLSKWGPGDDSFADPIRLTTDASDQANPDIAIGADNKLYVVWQDSRRGNWDVYLRTSSNGANWSTETRITESDADQTAPTIAVGGASACHVAWEDDGEGHSDIYVASSGDDFLSQNVNRVTSDVSDQSDPDIAMDASGNVYLVWTDARGGSYDIYGAASNGGSWANIPLATGAGHQYAPALATESAGVGLHLVWVSDAGGSSDVYYAVTQGMPADSLVGVDLIDDSSGADQLAPTVVTVGSAGNGLRVFVCWQDWRNATADGLDADLYFVEVKEAGETNVLIGDGGTGYDQSEPAIGVDSDGFPHVVWTDDRGANTEIYYAGTTSWGSEVLDSRTVTASEGGTVGVTSPANVDDVSVVIPPAASSQDATISVAKIKNAPAVPSSGVLPYEFGPSGLRFGQPVTITIPYSVAEFGDRPPTALWYDSKTGGLSQEGITNIEHLTLSPTVQALRFRTTHFTPYYLVSTTAMEEIAAGSGGGCSLSRSDESDIVSYFIPYGLIACVMMGLRIRDARRRT